MVTYQSHVFLEKLPFPLCSLSSLYRVALTIPWLGLHCHYNKPSWSHGESLLRLYYYYYLALLALPLATGRLTFSCPRSLMQWWFRFGAETSLHHSFHSAQSIRSVRGRVANLQSLLYSHHQRLFTFVVRSYSTPRDGLLVRVGGLITLNKYDFGVLFGFLFECDEFSLVVCAPLRPVPVGSFVVGPQVS